MTWWIWCPVLIKNIIVFTARWYSGRFWQSSQKSGGTTGAKKHNRRSPALFTVISVHYDGIAVVSGFPRGGKINQHESFELSSTSVTPESLESPNQKKHLMCCSVNCSTKDACSQLWERSWWCKYVSIVPIVRTYWRVGRYRYHHDWQALACSWLASMLVVSSPCSPACCH